MSTVDTVELKEPVEWVTRSLLLSLSLVWLPVFVCARVCLVLEKPQHLPSNPASAISSTFAICFVALHTSGCPRRTTVRARNVHSDATTPIFEFFWPEWDKSGISQLPSFLVSDEAGNKFPKKTYPGIKYTLPGSKSQGLGPQGVWRGGVGATNTLGPGP